MAKDSITDTLSIKDLERQSWGAKATAYYHWVGAITVGAIEPLLDACQVSAGMRVLDVACGPGYGAAQAAARGATSVGVDFAPAMVLEAQRKFPGIEFQEGDAENLGFGENGFDAVICAFGMLHMERPEQAIAEAYRVLASGGRYAFTVWATPERHEFFRLVLGAIQAHGRLDVALPPAPPLFRFSNPEECQRALTAVGFVDVSVRDVPLIWQTDSADAVVDLIYKSTVRAAMLLENQTPKHGSAFTGPSSRVRRRPWATAHTRCHSPQCCRPPENRETR